MPAKKSKSDPQSPSKKQKQHHHHEQKEPHELTPESTERTGEDQKDPNHASSHEGKHDTTTTQADEESEKQKEGSEWRDRPPTVPRAATSTPRRSTKLSAPFQWAAIFHKEDLHFENGAKGLAFYHAQKKHTCHDLPCKVSCAYCHAPIMDEGRNMVLMFPAIIKFKDEEAKKGFEPTMHIFYSRRCLDIKDGKTKWAELDEKSDEISETG
ncbi:hypothetical protein PG999_012589 [Apiospora kogelbergensis]|uniref:CENP-V/GFA domain-containing protein n=1 Tax=Apiospora kogelbergensis TaxID=1337665 RepID=A0AAW0Q920_9PEZI